VSDRRVGIRRTQYTTSHEQEDIWITQVEFPTKEGEWKHRVLRRPSVEKNKKGSFPSHIPEQELEETVDHKSLERSTTNQLQLIAELGSCVFTSYISRITSITNAASRENNAIRRRWHIWGPST
jgi:hypothetical protein